MNAEYTSKNGKIVKGTNKFARIQYIRSFGAFFVTTSDYTVRNQYRFEDEAAALEFANNFCK